VGAGKGDAWWPTGGTEARKRIGDKWRSMAGSRLCEILCSKGEMAYTVHIIDDIISSIGVFLPLHYICMKNVFIFLLEDVIWDSRTLHCVTLLKHRQHVVCLLYTMTNGCPYVCRN
jgi:hypothetical protein